MAHILIVDDDPGLLDVLALSLSEAGHRVLTSKDGADGLRSLTEARPDLAIVDVNMPRLDGFSLTRQARAKGVRTPIMILTSRDDEVDEALGLELGADDYIPKPFSTRVLLARINVLLLRGAGPRDDVLTIGDLHIDIARMKLKYRDVIVNVTVTELRLLEALARKAGIVLSRARLLEYARGDDSVVGDRLIDTYVRRLRRKLEEIDPTFDRIETIVGAGYRWRA
jgi:DNA-binding response OmpR family regulator